MMLPAEIYVYARAPLPDVPLNYTLFNGYRLHVFMRIDCRCRPGDTVHGSETTIHSMVLRRVPRVRPPHTPRVVPGVGVSTVDLYGVADAPQNGNSSVVMASTRSTALYIIEWYVLRAFPAACESDGDGDN